MRWIHIKLFIPPKQGVCKQHLWNGATPFSHETTFQLAKN